MKKLLLCLLMLVACVSVNASTGSSVKDIKIENVEVEIKENIGYNEKLAINYSINPKDANDLELVWSVSGTKKGATAELENTLTKTAEGTVNLTINNTTDKEVKLTLKAKQNGKTLISKEIVVEAKETTITRVTKEVKDLITNLEENVNKNNYEETKELVNKISELLKNNEELEDLINEDLLDKYEEVSETVSNYKESNTAVTIISIILVVIFSALIFWIFKKEEK